MSGRSRRLLLTGIAVFAVAACRRSPTDDGKVRADILAGSRDGKAVTEVSIGTEVGAPKALSIVVDKRFRGQEPLEVAPWHVDGGNWDFFEAHIGNNRNARLLFGVSSGRPGSGPIAWGEAFIASPDRTSGALAAEAFAKALGQAVPAAKSPQPLVGHRFHTAVLGVDVERGPRGGFGSRKGRWTATKWFLEENGVEAEIYFNYDLDQGAAEFSEKDTDYNRDVVAILARFLRDGPRPERTVESDPTLQGSGPRFSGWRLLSRTGHEGAFSNDGAYVSFVERVEGGGERLVRMSVAVDGAGLEVFRTEGHIVDRRTLAGAETKLILLLSHPKAPGSWSSEDPVDLLLVEKGSAKPIAGPWGTRLSISEAALSPGGRFLAISEWRDRTDRKVGRYQAVHILDLTTNRAKTLSEENTSLNPGSWVEGKGQPRLLVADGFRFDKRPLKYRLVEPVSGASTSSTAPKDPANPSVPAPQGGLSFRLVPGKYLEFEENGVPVRRFEFHEEDSRLAEDECCEWVSPRYVYFRGPRPSFIDSANGRMNFPASMKPDLGLLGFSRDFRRVLSRREDGLWLGVVSSP